MRLNRSLLVIAAGLLAGAPLGAQGLGPAATPAQRSIARARASIDKAPGAATGHVELAMALARRARETADPDLYDQADQAIAKALELSPGDFEAMKARAWVLLGQHRFAEARELAEALNRSVPDDVMVYGLLADASVELGDYEGAERACQWMLDLRPGNVPALTRAAYLRELFGDVQGAAELMAQAFDATPVGENEDRAWLLTQMAHLDLITGESLDAEKRLEQALRLFPDYHYALAQLARARTAQGRHAEAASLLRQRYETAAHPENLYELAVSLERGGRRAEASAAFAAFEKAALQEAEGEDNANRELIFYYADHARRPADALAVAQRQLARRRDVHTLDAYAWALYRSGRFGEAGKAIDQVLAVGIRDASMLYHAGAIAAKRGDRATARTRLRESLELNPVSEVAKEVRRALERLR